MSIEYFSWSALQLSELSQQLLATLNHRYQSFERLVANETDDGEDRAITHNYRDELRRLLKTWCEHFDVTPSAVEGYEKVTPGWIGGQSWMVKFDFNVAVYGLLGGIHDTKKVALYRPKVLEKASTEVMEWLRTRPNDIDRVHPRSFEVIVAEMLKDKGWNVELTKTTRDGGYDILAVQSSMLGFPIVALVECKLYDLHHPVGIAMVDRLMGVRYRQHANRAILVTNSRYSSDAWKAWESCVGRNLNLIDREELIEWLKNYVGNSSPER